MGRFRIDLVKLDLALAVVLTIALELEIWLSANQPHHKVAASLIGPVLTGMIAIRRRHPFLVGLVTILVIVPLPPASLATWGAAWIIDMYALAAWCRRREFLIGLGVYWVSAFASIPLRDVSVPSTFQFMIISTIVLVLVHVVLGERDRKLRMAERERELAAREAVVEERARIARELHDAIAHHVSMMVVQAGAERRVLDEERGSTREVLQTIEQIGRGALTEMRRLVGMLRSDGDEPLAPQPGLGDVPTLVGQVRDAGLPVELEVEGERRELPAGIELSAYRIVQEALTNALKHAGDARATVRIRYGDDSLELEIVDDGAGAAAARGAGSGHGLVGMRERVALYGGRFDASRLADGGFAVRVLLPVR